MTGSEKLRKENQSLRNEVVELKKQLEKLHQNLSKKDDHVEKSVMSPSRTASVEFVSDKYDELVTFKTKAQKELQEIKTRLNMIADKCQNISSAIDAMELYSYQYNVKIVGMPLVAERETSEQTTSLCLQLFSLLGVKDVSINDIDTAHRVPFRNPSNRPNTIICKFIRRLAKDKVMAARKSTRNLQATDFGFSTEIDVSHISMYDHLTPRLQTLLFEAKKYQASKNFRFCWTKNGFVYLRETEHSTIRKLANLEDLASIRDG